MKYLILIICLFISALSFNILQYPNHIVSGGVPGISIIINHYTNIGPSTIIFILSFTLFIISYIFLGKKKTLSSIVSFILYPIFIKLTSLLKIEFIFNQVIISILIGIVTGITVGLIYKIGFNNGGISILVEVVSKYTKLSIPTISFIINILIILLGWKSQGNNMIIYSSIIIVINSLVIKILLFRSSIH